MTIRVTRMARCAQNVGPLRMKMAFSSFLHHLRSRLTASMAADLVVSGEKAAYSSKDWVA